jgi:hypothetical protein
MKRISIHEGLRLTEGLELTKEEWRAVLKIMKQPCDLGLYDHHPQLPEPDFTLDEIDTAEQVMKEIG